MNLVENNLIRFKNISKKKETMYANFRVKGMRRGVVFTANIAVDLAAAEMHPGDTLEDIIEKCADMGMKEFQAAECTFEGLETI